MNGARGRARTKMQTRMRIKFAAGDVASCPNRLEEKLLLVNLLTFSFIEELTTKKKSCRDMREREGGREGGRERQGTEL